MSKVEWWHAGAEMKQLECGRAEVDNPCLVFVARVAGDDS